MLERRFSTGARAVVAHAQEEARDLRHRSLGDEHLLLGVLRELELPGLDADAVREALRARFEPSDAMTYGQVPFTPAARAVLDQALREALSLGHEDVRAGHVLLALLRSPGAFVADAIAPIGAERLRAEVLGGFERAPDADPDGRALLAILARDGAAAALLRDHGITPDLVRQRLG